jgi:hypothetical protein
MSALAFFPWLALETDMSIEGYHLLRFIRGQEPGLEQETIDGVLEAYLGGEMRPVPRATILTIAGRDILADLEDDQMAELFEVGELVAFTGLASREYFMPGGYANRETFDLIVQHFTGRGQGVGVLSRRRDGTATTYVSPGQNRVRRPRSQYAVTHVRLNERFLGALVCARDHEDWEHLAESIYFFNKANTDSDVVSEESECVEMVGAFERLLQCYHGKEHELAEAFCDLWQPSAWLDRALCTRVSEEQRDRPVAETWIRDFFVYRGFHAHGRRAIRRPTVWSRREHLLLGAYAFPLLVKLWLRKRELYELADDDESDIDIFEQLACADHFAPQPGDEVPDYPWIAIRGRNAFHRALERGWKHVFGDTTPNPPPPGE